MRYFPLFWLYKGFRISSHCFSNPGDGSGLPALLISDYSFVLFPPSCVQSTPRIKSPLFIIPGQLLFPVTPHPVTVDYSTLLCFFSIAPFTIYNYLLVYMLINISLFPTSNCDSHEKGFQNVVTIISSMSSESQVLNNNLLKE